jgi:hypothetical protein
LILGIEELNFERIRFLVSTDFIISPCLPYNSGMHPYGYCRCRIVAKESNVGDSNWKERVVLLGDFILLGLDCFLLSV